MQQRAIVPEGFIRAAKNTSGVTIEAHRLVKLTASDEIAICTAATDTIYGVTTHAIADGKMGDVQVGGKAVVIAGAALASPGTTRITSDSTGRGVAATVAAGSVVGIAGIQITAAAAANALFEVELMPHGGVALGGAVALKLPISYETADGATLYTVPTGLKLAIDRVFWEVTTSFTGGSSSAIGVSSDQAPHETAGDLLGGVSGDVAATLVSTGSPHKGGTVGASFGSNGVVVLAAGSVISFDRITSVFTAGAGFVHVQGQFIA